MKEPKFDTKCEFPKIRRPEKIANGKTVAVRAPTKKTPN